MRENLGELGKIEEMLLSCPPEVESLATPLIIITPPPPPRDPQAELNQRLYDFKFCNSPSEPYSFYLEHCTKLPVPEH